MFHASSLLVFLVWLSLPTESVQEVYSSAAELVKLASAEDAILDAMQTYLEKDIQRLQHIQRQVHCISCRDEQGFVSLQVERRNASNFCGLGLLRVSS